MTLDYQRGRRHSRLTWFVYALCVAIAAALLIVGVVGGIDSAEAPPVHTTPVPTATVTAPGPTATVTATATTTVRATVRTTVTTRVTATRTKVVSRSSTRAAVAGGTVWDRIAECESGGDWSIHTGNGFEGGLQFTLTSWLGMGGGEYAPHAYLASRDQQIAVAIRLQRVQGWGAWPVCSRRVGLR